MKMEMETMQVEPHRLEVVQDLLAALTDGDLADVSLVGHDGAEIPACRFVLAARSRVLKRMLYGNFREAKSNNPKIDLLDYSGQTLRMVVKYCSCGTTLDDHLKSSSATEEFVRVLVQANKAADYLEIPGLMRETERLVKESIAEHSLLACPVFDEANEGSALFSYAKRIIQCRPYVALCPPENAAKHDECEGGGVECLKSDRVVSILKDTEMEAGELFLFEMLQRWVDHVPGNCLQEALEVARECGAYFRLHYIEPDILLSTVQKSGLFPPNLIVEAIMRQALKASQNRVWTISCRGKEAHVDRILVEGGGCNEVNGIYYRIRGLHKGDVYSKREVSCGQLYVCTLSCSQKDDIIESRIFCSKVMTHQAIQSILMQRQTEVAPTPVVLFQPLLQVISLEAPDKGNHDASPLAKLCKIKLSDGDRFITGTFAPELTEMVKEQQIVTNSLVKVLTYNMYEYEGKQKIHVLDVSLVSADPGHRLGNPMELLSSTLTASLRNDDDGNTNSDDDGLKKLYSCYYPMDQQAKDSKIPRTGWTMEQDGAAPAPRCTWIPATFRRFGDLSRCNSQEVQEDEGDDDE